MALRNGLCDACLREMAAEQGVLLQVARCGWTGTFHVRCCGEAAMRALQTCGTAHEKALALEALELYLVEQRRSLTNAVYEGAPSGVEDM